MQKILTFILPVALCGTFAAAQQIGCPATTSSVVGSYGYVATEIPLSGSTVTPPGTNSTTFSSTPIGKLVGDVTGGGEFWASGVLYFDGAGNVSVGASSSSVGASNVVGTYTVNSDCTINVTLSDVFSTTTVTNSGVTSPVTSSVMLVGLVLGGGSQIVLSAPQSSTSTNGNMPLIQGAFSSRLIIQLTRALTYCSASSLTGSYGLIGTGFAPLSTSTSTTTGTGTTSTTVPDSQPAILIASVSFDGNGHVIAQAVGGNSPLGSFQLTGTYTVNLDCSGTMALSTVASPNTSTSTGTTTGTTGTTGTTTTTTTTTSTTSTNFLVDFVLTAPSGATALSGYSSRPAIEFTLWNGTETFFGLGTAQ
jgi:hypothetical protein